MLGYLTAKQRQELLNWLGNKNLTDYSGACGGRFTYCFTPTSLGAMVTVIGNNGSTKIDLTDYYDW